MNSESFIAMEITNDDISDWLSSEIQFKCLRGVRTENEDHDWLRNTDDRCQSGIGRELEVIGDAGNGGGESMMSSMIRKNEEVKNAENHKCCILVFYIPYCTYRNICSL